jgi:hypothetical protein
MAVRHGYGKIAGTDALIFAYDTGDTRNSYKGEPTVNLAGTDAARTIGFHNQGTYGNAGSVSDAPEKGPGWKKITVTNRGNNFRIAQFPYTSLTGGVTYSYSLEVDMGITSGYYWRIDGSGGYSAITIVNNRAVTTITPSAGVYAIFLNHNTTSISGISEVIYYRYYQVEQKSHPTSFTTSTRSATQGLLDLTGNSTLNLSNVSFNSNAQPTWDGTTDQIALTGFTQPDDPNIYTVEAVVKLYAHNPGTNIGSVIVNNYSALYGWIFYLKGPLSYLGIRHHDGGSGGYDLVYGTGISLNQWYHIAATDDKTTVRLYLNGVQVASRASATALNYSGQPLIGQFGGNNAVTNGDIPVVKIYNRALTAAEVQSNFKNYKKRFEGLDYYYDNTTDGGRWIRFWWYTGVGWPGHETAALGHPFGTFDSSNHYGFQRLPAGLTKSQVELLAKDGSGNVYKWDFANGSSTAQRVWDSMTAGTQGVFANGGAFNPTVIAGAFHGVQQDSWQYRVSEGVASFLLDDDTCDCVSTLNAGHAMCGGSGWNQQYAQPDGAYLRYGVDTLNDGGCLGPVPTRQLELYYRIKQ